MICNYLQLYVVILNTLFYLVRKKRLDNKTGIGISEIIRNYSVKRFILPSVWRFYFTSALILMASMLSWSQRFVSSLTPS